MNLNPAPSAVVLLSGGLDSAVTLAYARRAGYTTHALTFDYGQRHRLEIERARQVAAALGAAAHKIVAVDLRTFGGSALTADLPVPDARAEIGAAGIPVTYVPARNTIFLSLALAWAEVLRAEAIFIGANAVDYSGYPDCRPEYFTAYEHLAALATREGVQGGWKPRIVAPLLKLSKAEIVRLGRELQVDFSLTSSCYNPTPAGRPCGVCESCRLRQKGFQEAGETDPTAR
jgi:7-cyano-7-deazaguanine synthase